MTLSLQLVKRMYHGGRCCFRRQVHVLSMNVYAPDVLATSANHEVLSDALWLVLHGHAWCGTRALTILLDCCLQAHMEIVKTHTHTHTLLSFVRERCDPVRRLRTRRPSQTEELLCSKNVRHCTSFARRTDLMPLLVGASVIRQWVLKHARL